jgi:hypothetical protein
MKPSAAERARVISGFQCPECHGVRIESSEWDLKPFRYTCNECGCMWDSLYYPSLTLDETS